MAADHCDLLCLDLPRAEELRRTRLGVEDAQRAAARAQALADPTRLALAAALAQGEELCVCDAAWVLERAQNLVSHHLRALRDAGLATTRRDGRTVFYALTDRGRSVLASVLAGSAMIAT
jgi:DNA-binding transcriptional ArsR family regulator